MKKTIFVIMMALLAVAGMNAQPQGRGHHGPRGGMNPEKMIEHRIAMLDKQLQLTPDQKSAIASIYGEQAEQAKAEMQQMQDKKVQPKPEEMKARKEQMKARQAEVDAKVAAVLTADQKAKYEQMVADREQRGNKARHHDGQRHAGKEKAECEGHDCKAAGHDCKADGHDCDKAKAGHECDKAKAGHECDKAKAQCDKTKAECSKGHECKDKAAGHDCKAAGHDCDKAKAGHNCDKAKAQCDKAKAECGKGHDCKDKAQCDGNACKKTN